MKDALSMLFPILLLASSLGYCYLFVTKIPKGIPRAFSLLPVFYLFSLLPWYYASPFARGITSFFITWITSFKLLLFSFDCGPLAALRNNYIDFAMVAIFPLSVSNMTNECRSTTDHAFVVVRYELVPIFNQPYLATSLQDFWGRRWNRMSSSILRQTIYNPTRQTLTGSYNVSVGQAKGLALIATLVVSGLMHELMFYYITCGMKPSWEVTWFFVLQGLCMGLEAALKHLAKLKGWRWSNTPVKVALSITFTVGFVVATAYWLLYLPVWRSSQKQCRRLVF